jgi:hypothetical protein
MLAKMQEGLQGLDFAVGLRQVECCLVLREEGDEEVAWLIAHKRPQICSV